MYYVVEDVCGEQEKIVKEFNTHKEATEYMRANYTLAERASGYVDIAKTSTEDEGMLTFEY